MKKQTMKAREELNFAKEKKQIVQFARPFEEGSLHGYVIDIGTNFFLLASLDQGFQFEQYTCLRLRDVRRLECPANRAVFYQAVRKIRGDKMPSKVKLNLTDARSILQSASPSIVTIHRENLNPDSCFIGYGLSDNKTTFEMIEIDPNGQWESEPSYFKLNQITRIDLPGPYERALLLVGGKLQIFRRKASD